LAAAVGGEASIGTTLAITKFCDVSGLLGNSFEGTIGGVGPTGAGVITDSSGNPVGVFASKSARSVGESAGSFTSSSTSAIIQFSNGRTTIGDTGKGALVSF